MASVLNNNLLSLLLALYRLEGPLSEVECSALADISETLMYFPDDWDLIAPTLTVVIESNATLQGLYQESLTKLEALNGQLPPHLLPTLAELEQDLPSDTNEPADFSHMMELASEENPEIAPDIPSPEILNAAIKICGTPQPEQSVKQVRAITRIWQFLQQRRSSQK
ncbi:hypothetical protein [[Phormidium] sp. ETS-05]|uniref:hypothetical protein n=1 Tax=[Phormidium] sp. ETS-05 TaxID=222819 RepID=UPI0018EEE810|nr:hypothetical protein [[Phormidium] sp. ETS-05]